MRLQVFADRIELHKVLVFRVKHPVQHLIRIFFQNLDVTHVLHVLFLKRPRSVHELAPQAIRTVQVLMVLFAQPSFILRRNMLLFLQFLVSVGKSAVVAKFANAG